MKSVYSTQSDEPGQKDTFKYWTVSNYKKATTSQIVKYAQFMQIVLPALRYADSQKVPRSVDSFTFTPR